MKTILSLLFLLMPSISFAQAYTSRMGLWQPALGSLNWGTPINADLAIIDSSAAIQGKYNQFSASSNTVTGQWIINGSSGALLLGTTVLPSNAIAISSGTVVIQSTSTTNGQPALQILNNAGTEIFRVEQDGKVGASTNTPTDVLSVAGSVNASVGFKTGTLAGVSGSCPAGQVPTAPTWSGGLWTAASACTAIASTMSSPEPSYQGVNYILASSSWPVVAISTGPGTYQIMPSSWVFRGTEYTTTQTNGTMVASTNTVVTWNPTNGFRQWGLVDFNPPSISSYTVNVWNDDIVVFMSSSNATDQVSFFDTSNRTPSTSVGMLYNGPGVPNTPPAGGISAVFNCLSGKFYWDSCVSTLVMQVPTPAYGGSFFNPSASVNNATIMSVVLNNTSGSSQNVVVFQGSASASTCWVSVDGKAAVTLANQTLGLISVGTGYHNLMIVSSNATTTMEEFSFKLPASTAIVRPWW